MGLFNDKVLRERGFGFTTMVIWASRLEVPSMLECRDACVSKDVKFQDWFVQSVKTVMTIARIVEYMFPMFGVLPHESILEE
jgi:hypothetical protein